MALTMTQAIPVFKEIRLLESSRKVVLITGGTCGIGLLLAELLIKQNINVAISGRCSSQGIQAWKKLEKIDGGEVAFISGDSAEYNDCRRIVGETTTLFNRLDAIVNCEGTRLKGPVGCFPTIDFQDAVSANTNGADYISEFAVPEIRKAGGGAIVTVSDVAAKTCHDVYSSDCAPKAMGDTITLEMVPCDVRLTCVFHGKVTLQKIESILAELDYRKKHIDNIKTNHRISSCSTAQEVAQIIYFLVSASLFPVANDLRTVAGELMVC